MLKNRAVSKIFAKQLKFKTTENCASKEYNSASDWLKTDKHH